MLRDISGDRFSTFIDVNFLYFIFSPKLGDLSYGGSTTWPECPRKNRLRKSCWQHPPESGPDVSKKPGNVIWLGPVLMWIQRSYPVVYGVYKIFDSDSTPALAEYNRTTNIFKLCTPTFA